MAEAKGLEGDLGCFNCGADPAEAEEVKASIEEEEKVLDLSESSAQESSGNPDQLMRRKATRRPSRSPKRRRHPILALNSFLSMFAA